MSSSQRIGNRQDNTHNNENDSADKGKHPILVKIFLVLQSVLANGDFANAHESEQDAQCGRNNIIEHLYLLLCLILRTISRDVGWRWWGVRVMGYKRDTETSWLFHPRNSEFESYRMVESLDDQTHNACVAEKVLTLLLQNKHHDQFFLRSECGVQFSPHKPWFYELVLIIREITITLQVRYIGYCVGRNTGPIGIS